MAPKEPNPLPTYKELPEDKKFWVWGNADELGSLNFLTPERVKAALQEVKTGERFSLNWGLNKPEFPGFGRKKFEHKHIQLVPNRVFDDEIHINTQSGSQWDGFGHVSNEHSIFYNNTTIQNIESYQKKGTQAWNDAGGIAGRGVLLDVAAWYEKQGRSLDALDTVAIPVEVLKTVARDQGVTFKVGDILFVRYGFTKAYEQLTIQQKKEWGAKQPPTCVGLAQGEDSLEWIFNNHFAAIAGDAIAFECYPEKTGGFMHQYFLSCWGKPIGEMFFLEDLAKRCHELGKYTFFVSSSPLNVPGGIASPPNIMAII